MRYLSLIKGLLGLAVATSGVGAHAAATLIYANHACSGTCALQSFSATTGANVGNFTQSKGNGRGVVTVGDIIYYTVADSGNIFKRRISDNADLGVAFAVAGASGLQAISFDGTNFWVGDYSGTNNAYLVNGTNGNLIKTVKLANAAGFYDGLEYFNGKLIANRFDGGFSGAQTYDVYSAVDGSLITANFINTASHGNGTGIAFDGAEFFVSDIFNNRITVWDGITGAFKRNIVLTGDPINLIEDISVDFADRMDTCGGPNQPPCNNIPTPATLPLAVLALFAAFAAPRLRNRQG